MATSRSRRRLAFQALYQLDVHEGDRDRAVGAWVAEAEDFSQAERDEALALATSAYDQRQQADAVLKRLAPAWPADRQPAVDRAILRLAIHEITRAGGGGTGKIAINDAVELAKEYSTDKSPKFINAVLDKVLKEAGGAGGAKPNAPGPASAGPASPRPTGPAPDQPPRGAT